MLDGVLQSRFLWGVLSYAVAFALPAVMHEGKSLSGWECAKLVTIGGIGAFTSNRTDLIELLCVPISLVNPAVVLLLAVRLGRPAWRQLTQALTAVAFLGLAASWLFLLLFKAPPHVGHLLWVGGILAIALAPTPQRASSSL